MTNSEIIINKISDLIGEYKKEVAKDNSLLDRFSLLHMTMDDEKDGVILSLVANQANFKILIYSLLKTDKNFASDIMKVVEDFKRDTYN